jgi:hypothetical protein
MYHKFPESLILMIPAISKEVKRKSALKRTDFKTPMSFSPIFLAIAMLFYIGGCIPYYIPTNEHGYKDQKTVTKDMVKQLEPGTTTKNDVELLFENFSSLMTGDSVYCYYWARTDGYYGYIVLLDIPYAAGFTSSDVHRSTEDIHAFCLEFMPDDKLKRFKHFESDEGMFNVHHQIEDWENEED